MSVNYTEWFVQLKNVRTRQPINDDSGVYSVMITSTPAEATIYSDDKGTTGSNPGTMTDGIIRFFTASSVTTVDVTFLTANGEPGFISGLTPSQHHFDVDVDRMTSRPLIIPFTISASSSAPSIDTGFDLNALHVVKDIKAKITTAGGTGTVLCVGGSSDLSAFGIFQMSATGFKYPVQILLSTLLANTLAHTQAAGYGLNLLASITSQMGRKEYFAGVATNIFIKDGNLTAATGAGYIYMILDKLVA
jgi:hypothetical protein